MNTITSKPAQGPTGEQMKARRRRASARMKKAKVAKSSRRRNRAA